MNIMIFQNKKKLVNFKKTFLGEFTNKPWIRGTKSAFGGGFTDSNSNGARMASFKYFLALESAYESSDIVFSKFSKKNIFQALAKSVLEKKTLKKFKKQPKIAFF